MQELGRVWWRDRGSGVLRPAFCLLILAALFTPIAMLLIGSYHLLEGLWTWMN